MKKEKNSELVPLFAIVAIAILSSVISISIFYVGTQFEYNLFIDNIVSHGIKKYQSDDYVVSLSNICSVYPDVREKIECVYDFFREVSRYNKTLVIHSPEYTLKNSSDCKNAVVFYCAVFRNLNINCREVFLKDHVIALVDFETGYCNIDQRRIDCVYYG